MTEKYFAGLIPPAKSSDLSKETAKIWKKYEKATADFALDKMIVAIKELNGVCDGYIEKHKPWSLAKTDQDKLAKVIYDLLEAIRHLGLMLYSIMPETAEKILSALGEGNFISRDFKELSKWGGLKTGSKITKIAALFPRLEKKS